MRIDMNVNIKCGYLANDSELKYTNTGTACLKFSIAISDGYKGSNGEEVKHTSFFNCIIWGKFGEIMAQYLKKGQQVIIKGKDRQDRWEKDGQKRSSVSIIVEDVQLIGAKKDNQGSGNNSGYNPPTGDNLPDTYDDDQIPF